MRNKKQPRVTRREAKSKHNLSESVINANKVEDLLHSFQPFKQYNKNNLNCTLESAQASKLSSDIGDWIFDLTKRNMKIMYEASKDGWRDEHKKKELTHSSARFLIARDATTNKPVGFTHFRFDMDYGFEVLYCYELQLEEDVRGAGLGRFILQVLELIAFSNQMAKVVLTVFKHNDDAVQFYKKCRYQIDETTPVDSLEETFDYVILSKKNRKKIKS